MVWMTPLLIPREHGTYGELAFPMLTSLLVFRPSTAAWGLTAVAIGGFLAHEAFLVLRGARGRRVQQTSALAARRSLLTFGVVILIGAGLALPAMTSISVWGLVAALVMSGAAVLVAVVGREHSLRGELLAAGALTSWSWPISLAGGAPIVPALSIWLLWWGVFGVATCGVHAVILRTTRRAATTAVIAGAVLATALVALAGALASGGQLPQAFIWTPVPAVATFIVLVVTPVRAHALRQIGWSVIGVSVVTLVLVIMTLG